MKLNRVLRKMGNDFQGEYKCEFCGVENYTIRENGSKVVLTIAHLDHTPENCEPDNLRALCQKCHNKYDGKHRAETRRKAVRGDGKVY
jgi:5-methylcytosine-specific restriction endonuclease McrA